MNEGNKMYKLQKYVMAGGLKTGFTGVSLTYLTGYFPDYNCGGGGGCPSVAYKDLSDLSDYIGF